MRMQQLGRSELVVSALCLGTMTYGEQNTEAQAHDQLDFAVERGVNFIDTAEMYPIPARAQTQGLTESYIGSWLARQPRHKLILATKIAGPNRGMAWIRDPLALTGEQMTIALEASLRRLQTDYVDLYQIHWPARKVPMFGETRFDPTDAPATPSIHSQLEGLARLVEAGKVRYIGVSNETPWGVAEFCRIADQYGLPRIVSIQNAYSLINRSFESGLAEMAHREAVPLLAYSPLAFGLLSGKYLNNPEAPGRLSQYPMFGGRYRKTNTAPAVADYVALARQRGLSPAQLALAFVASRHFVGSTIIGATNLDQLAENIGALQVPLDEAMLSAIDAIHERYPNPAP